MKPATNFTLTPRNAPGIARYAELAGVSPQRFLNAFLAESPLVASPIIRSQT